jgi:DNA-binding beta-propeller fold protein YncE
MRKTFIALLLVLFLSEPAFCWEMYISNESANSITVYNQEGVLIDTITDFSIIEPRQLAFRDNGNLYVACGSSKIVIIDQNKNVIGSINIPMQGGGLAIGGNNHLYVGLTNTPTPTIYEYAENDNFVRSFGLNPFKPDSMNIGPNGHLYVIGFGLHEFDLNGNLIKSVRVEECLRGVDIGQDGLIYVAEGCTNVIEVRDSDSFQVLRTITGFTGPYGVTFDPENHHLFVANFGAGNILEYLYTGEFIGVFASGLSGPDHVAFKSSGTSTTTTVNGSTFYPAPVSKTGQAISCADGDDGALQKGVVWPIPRFTDNQNGTVTDNLTGLMWIKNAQIIQGK